MTLAGSVLSMMALHTYFKLLYGGICKVPIAEPRVENNQLQTD